MKLFNLKYNFQLKWIFFIVSSFVFTHSFSQNKNSLSNKNQILLENAIDIKQNDSAILILNKLISSIKNEEDSVYIKSIYWKAYKFYRLYQNDSALTYFEKANKLSSKYKIKKIEVKTLNYIGLIFKKKGDYNNCLKYLLKSSEKANEYNIKNREAASLNNLGLIYRELGSYDKSLDYLTKAYFIYKQIEDTLSLMSTMNNLGLVNKDLKDYKHAYKYYIKTLALANRINNIKHKSRIYLNLGVLYGEQNKFDKALEYYFKSLKLKKIINDEYQLAINYSNIADIYIKIKDYQKAISYHKKAIKALGNKGSIKDNISYNNNIANAYIQNKQYKFAYKHLLISEKLLETHDIKETNYKLLSNTNQLISLYFQKTKNYKKALEYNLLYSKYKDSLSNWELLNKIAKQKAKLDFQSQKAELQQLKSQTELNNIISQKQKEALKNDKFIFLGTTIILIIGLISFLIVKIQLDKKKKATKLLKENRKLLLKKNYEITLQNNEIKSQTEQLYGINDDLMQLKTAIDETDNVVVILDKEGNFEWGNKGFDRLYDIDFNDFIKKYPNILDASKNSSNYEMMSSVIKKCINEKASGSYEFSTFNRSGKKIWIQTNIKAVTDISGNIQNIIVIDTDISEKVQVGRLLEQKNFKLEKQKEEIDASLRYAQTIQKAILPAPLTMRKDNDFFLIYLPKDIVSGDFYWFSDPKDSPYTFFAVVDCTGHGVPGAFMSMIGARMLNFIVSEKNIYDPAEILEQMHISVNVALKQKDTGNKDGMDISICRFEKTTSKQKSIVFSGAKQSIYYYKNNRLTRLRGDNKTIGGHFYDEVEFTNKKFTLSSNDMIYMLTDGYIDQDSPNGKKIGSPNIFKLLKKVAPYPLKQQKHVLLEFLNSHKEKTHQRDDITFLGIKID